MIRLVLLLLIYSVSITHAGHSLHGKTANQILDTKPHPKLSARKTSSAFQFKNTCKDTQGRTHNFGDTTFEQCVINQQSQRSPSKPEGENTYGVGVGASTK